MPDSFQPLFVFSFFKTAGAFHPPRGASFVWDLVLLVILCSYRVFLAVGTQAWRNTQMSGIEAESIVEVTQKAIAATEVEENKTPCFNDNVDECLWVVDLMYRSVMEKCWKDSALAKRFASFFEVGFKRGLKRSRRCARARATCSGSVGAE